MEEKINKQPSEDASDQPEPVIVSGGFQLPKLAMNNRVRQDDGQ